MWNSLEEIDFNDKIEVIHCDTRDFHCNVVYDVPEKRIQLTEGYIFTIEQVKEVLLKLKQESGGEGKWRMLSFIKDNKDISGWDWKYIRIYKTDKGYGISPRSQCQFVKKQFFKHHKIDDRHLNHIKEK